MKTRGQRWLEWSKAAFTRLGLGMSSPYYVDGHGVCYVRDFSGNYHVALDRGVRFAKTAKLARRYGRADFLFEGQRWSSVFG